MSIKTESQHKHRSSGHRSSHDHHFIKPEPDDWERSRPHRYSHETDRRSAYHRHRHENDRSHGRLKEPVVFDSESHQKRRRVSSPVLLRDDEEMKSSPGRSAKYSSQSSAADLSRSGLLNKAPSNLPKQKANFELSGKLTEDTNTYKGVVIKYNEPEDARKPTEHWRLYPFKGKETLRILHIHRQSGFLIGRDRKIADIPMDHPSISKQHAVLQYRQVRGLIRLYLMDLESANGTYLNNQRIDSRRYYELLEKDMIKFGFSSREHVVMKADAGSESEDETEENGA